MKVHVAFSLNVPGSFADDIIHVDSVRYRPLGSLLAKNGIDIIRHRINLNEKIFCSFYRRNKNYLSHNNILQ